LKPKSKEPHQEPETGAEQPATSNEERVTSNSGKTFL